MNILKKLNLIFKKKVIDYYEFSGILYNAPQRKAAYNILNFKRI